MGRPTDLDKERECFIAVLATPFPMLGMGKSSLILWEKPAYKTLGLRVERLKTCQSTFRLPCLFLRLNFSTPQLLNQNGYVERHPICHHRSLPDNQALPRLIFDLSESTKRVDKRTRIGSSRLSVSIQNNAEEE